MAANGDIHLGFYLVANDPNAGWMGGLLVLNSGGRPLEFHCSLPLRPTRTQQILYGPSLESYLVGDLIGKAVLARAKLRPHLVLVEDHAALALSTSSGFPMVCFGDPPEDGGDYEAITIDGAQAFVSLGHQQQVVEVLSQLPRSLDLSEPFDRIREAFNEARGTSRAAG